MTMGNGSDVGPRPIVRAFEELMASQKVGSNPPYSHPGVKRDHGVGTTLNPRGAKSITAMTLRLCDGLRVLCVKNCDVMAIVARSFRPNDPCRGVARNGLRRVSRPPILIHGIAAIES